MLAFLLTIFTLTLTPNSKSSVKAEGTLPEESQTYFQQTGNGKYGQMTANNSTTLRLANLSNIRLHSVTVNMHSNTSSGSGSMLIKTNQRPLFSLPEGTFADWTGDYSTTAVPIVYEPNTAIAFGGQQNELTITITASENSLYVDSYVITYSAMPPAQHHVFFETGTDYQVKRIRESAVGSGVVLPSCPDASDAWRFVGWSTESIERAVNATQKPLVLLAGTRFYPQAPTVLYALYMNGSEQLWQPSELTDGEGLYLITYPLWQVMATAPESSKRYYTQSCTISEMSPSVWVKMDASFPEEALFEIQIFGDSMLIRHHLTQQYLGAPTSSTSGITKQAKPWRYDFNDNNQVVIFKTLYGDTLSLLAYPSQSLAEGDVYWYQVRKNMNTNHANLLFDINDCPIATDVIYTSYPLSTSLPDVEMDEHVVQWYDLLGRPVQYLNERGIYVRKGKVQIVW